jgi:hypothetical protein
MNGRIEILQERAGEVGCHAHSPVSASGLLLWFPTRVQASDAVLGDREGGLWPERQTGLGT